MKEESLEVKSNVLFGAINVSLVFMVYLFVLFLGHLYLKYYHGIDIMDILMSYANIPALPFIGELIGFAEEIFESILIDSIIAGLVYAAYISNYELKVKRTEMESQKGFLLIEKKQIKLEDVEQVFTEEYTFFKTTKSLHILALNEDTIKMPYVLNADEIKEKIIKMVKERHAEVDMEKRLHAPIKAKNEDRSDSSRGSGDETQTVDRDNTKSPD